MHVHGAASPKALIDLFQNGHRLAFSKRIHLGLSAKRPHLRCTSPSLPSVGGSEFTPQMQATAPMASNANNDHFNIKRKADLEKEKSKRGMWGIVFLFLFWPVSVYHFYKWYQADQELKKLQ